MSEEKKVWPNYYQLALMLGCDSLEHTQIVKKNIIDFVMKEENSPLMQSDYLKHTVAAVNEIEELFKNNEKFNVSVENIDSQNLNIRDMESIIHFGINPKFLTDCLFNPNLYRYNNVKIEQQEV